MRKYITLTLIVLFSQINFSQTPQWRQKIAQEYKLSNDGSVVFDAVKYAKNEKELAEAKAKSMGIPIKIVDQFGKEGDLVRFDGDLPIYYTAFNDEAVITTRANLLYAGGGLGVNLTGTDMLAGVWDQNIPRMTHLGWEGRIQNINSAPVSNHSTHVTGTILSSGINSVASKGRGIAYNASGWIFDWTNDINEMNQYAGLGLIISNHSYGLVASTLPVWYFGAYVSDSNAVDNVCFNNPKYIPIYAAGNDRDSYESLNSTKGGADLLTGDKTSKNSIVVGAVQSVLSYAQSSDVIISNFSSYGPTDDFRIKPDLVAKGVNVYSSISTSDTSYGTLSGTSMAAPGVTGSLLLVQEYYNSMFEEEETYMNSATLRGLAIHTADESGPNPGPDHMFGWGLLNVAKMVEVLQGIGENAIVLETTLNNSQEYTFNVLANELEDLKVSITWTDRPGTTTSNGATDQATPRLVNDLDVRVTQSETTFLPWALNKSWSNLNAIKADNNVDNVERIDISNPSGVYQIKVNHKGTLTGGSQNYSLIVTGVDADAVLSSENFLVDNDLIIWQSPNDRSILNYTISNYTSSGKILIFDMQGRKVVTEKITASEGKIRMNNSSKGVYLVTIQLDNGKNIFKKIIL